MGSLQQLDAGRLNRRALTLITFIFSVYLTHYLADRVDLYELDMVSLDHFVKYFASDVLLVSFWTATLR